MTRIGLDPETRVVNEVFALIYAPGRTRDRFPENCVTVMESEAAALEGADSEKNLYPARVIGPSRVLSQSSASRATGPNWLVVTP